MSRSQEQLCLLGLACLIAAMPLRSIAQDEAFSLDDLIATGEQWLRENVDPAVMKQFESLELKDPAQAERLFVDLQQRLQGDYVVDLAAFRRTAAALLPVLEASDAAAPYAAWLRSRLDYLEVADELRIAVPPPNSNAAQPDEKAVTRAPGTKPSATPSQTPLPNPPAGAQRAIWERRTGERPPPKDATRYVNRLKPIFAAFGVPEELVWIAEVESAFNREALSPVGAAGLFQLMPITARGQGLLLKPGDERLHPEKSARAAASYLHHLHERFDDWRLALAAYNAGEGRVQALMERHKATSFDELSTHLPAETQMYVPRIEAVIRRREGKSLGELRPE